MNWTPASAGVTGEGGRAADNNLALAGLVFGTLVVIISFLREASASPSGVTASQGASL